MKSLIVNACIMTFIPIGIYYFFEEIHHLSSWSPFALAFGIGGILAWIVTCTAIVFDNWPRLVATLASFSGLFLAGPLVALRAPSLSLGADIFFLMFSGTLWMAFMVFYNRLHCKRPFLPKKAFLIPIAQIITLLALLR